MNNGYLLLHMLQGRETDVEIVVFRVKFDQYNKLSLGDSCCVFVRKHSDGHKLTENI